MQDVEKPNKQPVARIVIAILLVGLVALGAMAFAPRVAQAQDATPTQPANPPVGSGGPHGLGHFDFFGRDSDRNYDTYLAEALGITVEELQAAKEAANAAALEDAVANGDITAEQADLIKARNALKKYIDEDALQAKALGITVEELQTALEEGKSIRTLIDELGLEVTDVRTAYKTAYQEAVQQAVEDGVITQAQADLILAEGSDGGMFGGMRGSGRHGGPPGDRNPKTPDTITTPYPAESDT